MKDAKIIEDLIVICRENPRGEVLTHIAKRLGITDQEAKLLIEYGRGRWLVEEEAARYKAK